MCISTWRKKFLLLLVMFLPIISWAQDRQDIQLADEYFQRGDLAKARQLYDELADDEANVALIHNNYLNLLINQEDFRAAERYLQRLIRNRANAERFQLDLAQVYAQQGETKKADKLYNEIIEAAAKNNFKTHTVAQQLMANRLYEKALRTYERAREVQPNPDESYSLQMAVLYNLLGQQNQMFEEYFRYIRQQPSRMQQAKNMLQNALTEPEDLQAFEALLFERVQQEPGNRQFSDLLIWLHLQQKNFYGAFVQARALQKRFKDGPEQLMEIGQIALENKDYAGAIKIFEYVNTAFPELPEHYLARRYLILSREQLVKTTYPVDTLEIRKLIHDYQQLVNEAENNPTAIDAQNSMAMLYAFYLDEKAKATEILNMLIQNPRTPARLRGQSKMALGDIYLLTAEPWEATLLYSQVEKAFKDDPLGYEAKLRNARLSYFKGEFGLAQGHLDVLKEATTREIANDAMALSQLIKNNSYLDSVDLPMQRYANSELLLFQNKKKEALEELDAMLKEYANHSLTDDILYRQANIYVELGEFQQAVDKLNLLVDNWSSDILADDAWFLRARLYEEYLQDHETAKTQYTEFLKRFPGSVYVAEARKRFRTLRGDFAN
ncbi:tetratricopeptide repeat protein [Cesiribacter sp. SM1]|uniref:tetratricopeptide repeat protein n=1 Tax=Cesiribacter sp. SM1 TaxID=2861196 RepID=UPI001CD6D2F9|nr:tetratricopeptide repeat protein [Cesiribacter sp. SM1]